MVMCKRWPAICKILKSGWTWLTILFAILIKLSDIQGVAQMLSGWHQFNSFINEYHGLISLLVIIALFVWGVRDITRKDTETKTMKQLLEDSRKLPALMAQYKLKEDRNDRLSSFIAIANSRCDTIQSGISTLSEKHTEQVRDHDIDSIISHCKEFVFHANELHKFEKRFTEEVPEKIDRPIQWITNPRGQRCMVPADNKPFISDLNDFVIKAKSWAGKLVQFHDNESKELATIKSQIDREIERMGHE